MSGSPITDEDLLIFGGLFLTQWLDLFYSCNQSVGFGLIQLGWPNGLPYTSQPVRDVRIFNIIKQEILAHQKRKTKK